MDYKNEENYIYQINITDMNLPGAVEEGPEVSADRLGEFVIPGPLVIALPVGVGLTWAVEGTVMPAGLNPLS